MTEEDRIAAAARLHVALRRKTGRVTDTEWMSVNVEYATAIVRIARAHAMATSDLDLAAIATGLPVTAWFPVALRTVSLGTIPLVLTRSFCAGSVLATRR